MEKYRGKDLGQKTTFFTQKISKICVTGVKSVKGTTTYSNKPVGKISSKNSERLWRNSLHKISGKKQYFPPTKYLKYV